MEKKYKLIRVLKSFIILLVISLFIYIIIGLYKFYVIHKVIEGMKNYSNNTYTNYYYKITLTFYGDKNVDVFKETTEIWNKDGKGKMIIQNNPTIIWANNNGGYIINTADKTASHINSDNLLAKSTKSFPNLVSVVYTIPDLKFELIDAFFLNTSVNVKEYNGKKYYVINSANSEELWVNKDTLFPLKNIYINHREYEYEFIPDIVTDQDVAAPNLTGYTITEYK